MKLFVEYYDVASTTLDATVVQVPLDTYIVVALCKYLPAVDVEVNFVRNSKRSLAPVWITIPHTGHTFDAAETDALCQLPTVTIDRRTVVSGLCAVCRCVTKRHIDGHEKPKMLLGFKGNTLVAPADASLWTKFCELDIVNCVRKVLTVEGSALPEEIGKFECHLAQPLKSHNVYKLINKVNNVRISSDEELRLIENEGDRFDFYANHKFAEGYEKTLADIMLFICFELMHRRIASECLVKLTPLTIGWMERVSSQQDGSLRKVCQQVLQWQSNIFQPLQSPTVDVPLNFSLYKSDTKKLNLKGDQILTTNQSEVLGILEKVQRMQVDIESSTANRRAANLFDWDDVPLDAKPEGSALPNSRILRKRHQLECLANEVIAIARTGDVIVDFCSGTGHLGILLAYLLPACTVYLLENKEESQVRAIERVHRMALDNVVFVQCNLDYFCARFDIGVSLHACGVATDIVLEKCFTQRARFVCCPCCYGKLYNIDHVSYPRSQRFQRSTLTLKEYFCLAHCADQTHDLDHGRTNVEKAHQGFYCMDTIDRDRAFRAEELGYTVHRTRLKPENCTPKNRLLVGTMARDRMG